MSETKPVLGKLEHRHRRVIGVEVKTGARSSLNGHLRIIGNLLISQKWKTGIYIAEANKYWLQRKTLTAQQGYRIRLRRTVRKLSAIYKEAPHVNFKWINSKA